MGDRAVMVAVVTTGEMREFVLYTGAGDWIAKFDGDLQAAAGDHTEVQVMAQRDPEWTAYSSAWRADPAVRCPAWRWQNRQNAVLWTHRSCRWPLVSTSGC